MRKSKNRYFYHIFVSPGDAPGAIMLNVVWMEREFDAEKRIRCLQIVSQHVPIYVQQFPSYSNRASVENRRFHVLQPTFSFPLETPLRLSHNMLHGWKDNSMPAKRLAACTYLSSIVSELYDAKSMRKSKNRYFYHTFVSPGDAPGAITLNLVWMERESDAYKLSRCMCPSIYNRLWDRARYVWNNRHFIIHPCIRRPR